MADEPIRNAEWEAQIPADTRRKAVVWVLASCLLLLGFAIWTEWRARDELLSVARRNSSNLAQSVARHAYDSMQAAELVLVAVVDGIEARGRGEQNLKELHQLMQTYVHQLPQLHGVFVYDEHGRWIANSQDTLLAGIDNSDREYFRYHLNHTDRGIHIGPPITSRSTGDWIVTVSRRINHPDGSFAGVAIATLRMEYFLNYYRGFDIGERGAIFVALDDGTMLIRRPFDPAMLGHNISRLPLFHDYLPQAPSGTQIFTSGQDGVTRINSYTLVKRYPLVVSAALSYDEVLRGWYRDTQIKLAVFLLLFSVLAWLGWSLIRQVQSGVTIEQQLLRAHRQLEDIAMRDALTGIANRRRFDQAVVEELARAGRVMTPVSLIMLDVDYFKQYNDIYGHAAGDACLQAIAKVIGTACFRIGDLSARYGGEEFVVLLPGTNLDGAMVVAERIRMAVQALKITHEGNPLRVVTVSAGVHSVIGSLKQTPADLLVHADQALYQAKRSGRNRVRQADPIGQGRHISLQGWQAPPDLPEPRAHGAK